MVKHTYEEAHKLALAYFNGEEISTSVYLNKYAMRDLDGDIVEPTPAYMHQRLASQFSRIDERYEETTDTVARTSFYYQAMDNFARIVPQGSVMAAVGNPYQTMSASNCVVEASPEDSISGIFRTAHNLAQLYKRRCGVGFDLSSLRPDGMNVNNAARTTTGAWSFADFFSEVTRKIGQCIAKGERVLTRNGLIPIEEVRPSIDSVWTKNGFVGVSNLFINGSKKIYKLQTSYGFSVRASEDHLFLTEEDGVLIEKRLGDFEEGDSVVLIPGAWRVGVGTDDLVCPEYVKKQYNNSNRLNEDVNFPRNITTDLAYILGLMYGDGGVEYDKFNEPLLISIACAHEHPAVQAQACKIIKSLFGIDASIRPGDGALNKVTINSKLVCHWLKANSLLKEKSTKIRVPSSILKASSEIQMSFLAGFFDADGTNGKSKKGYSFSTTSFSFAKDIQIMLMANGIISKIHTEDRTSKEWRDLYSVAITGTHAQEALVACIDGGTFPAEKIYERFISKRDNYTTPYKAKSLGVTHNQYDFIPDNSHFVSATAYLKIKSAGEKLAQSGLLIKATVSSITEDGVEETFDLELPEEHLFWCEGFYVHNSGRRGALMITLDVHHPDVLKFTNMKHDLTQVTGANISLRLSDEFLKAVEEGADYEVRWPCESKTPKVSRKVSARRVWDAIVDSATKSAEPGLVLWNNAVRTLPAHCYPRFKSVSTNPCCFDKDSSVTVITHDGLKEIKSITSSDLVWVDEHKTWAKTSGYFEAGSAEVFKVTLSNNESLCITGNHKLERLTRIQRAKNQRHVEYTRQLVELKDLGVDDLIALHKEEVDGCFGTAGSYDDGLILGWLTGDGCLSYLNEDAAFPTMYLSFWEGEYDVGEKILSAVNEYGFGLTLPSGNDGYDNTVKRIGSMALTRTLTEKYQTNLWKFKNGFNEFLYSASKDFVRGYLSSYFSADGTVASESDNSRFGVSLSSVDYDRLIQVKNLLSLFGISCHIGLLREAGTCKIRGREYYNQKCYRLSISGYKNLLRFREYIGFAANEKAEQLNDIFENFKREGRTSEAYAKIVSIESVGVKEVGCIEVDGYHKFTANGIISGNSEIILSASDSCRLISLNLTNYVNNPFEGSAHFDFERFIADVATQAQMGDNLVDLELELIQSIIKVIKDTGTTPEDVEQEISIWQKLHDAGRDGRRTGLGTHGLADALAQLRIRYDSEAAIDIVDKIYRAFKETAYRTSVELAKTRGAFPEFNWDLEKDNPFIQDLPEDLKEDMAKYGRRNISMLTQAPTGSVAIISKLGNFAYFNVSSGVEPVFRIYFIRRKKVNPNDVGVRVDFTDINGDSWQEYKQFSNNARAYLEKFGLDESSPLPEFFVNSDEVDWTKRIQIQAAEQRHIDHSISSTINLPAGTPNSVVSKIYMEAWKYGLKGVTVYVDGSRDGVLVTGDKQALKCENYLIGHYSQVFDKEGFELWDSIAGKLEGISKELKETAKAKAAAQGNFDWDTADKIVLPKYTKQDVLSWFTPIFDAPGQAFAPKRDKILDSETHKIRIDFGNGEPRNAYVTVSFFPGTKKPYEVLVIAPYFGLEEKDLQILELTARTTSMNLRHGVPILFICEQLDKIGGQYIFSLPTNIARVLRTYADEQQEEEAITKTIDDFDKRNAVPLEKCPSCGKRTYRKTGAACGNCTNEECTYSGCG